MDLEEVRRLLGVEYERLQASIDKFDDQRFKVKGWAIAGSGAFFAFGANVKKPALVLSGVLLVLFFGYLEVVFMDIQAVVINRSNEVERLLELARRTGLGADHDSYEFGIGKIFHVGVLQWRDIPRLLRHRHNITVFYGGLMLAMTLGAILLWLIE